MFLRLRCHCPDFSVSMDGSFPEGAQPTNAVMALVELAVLVVLELDPADAVDIESDFVPTGSSGILLVLDLARTNHSIVGPVAHVLYLPTIPCWDLLVDNPCWIRSNRNCMFRNWLLRNSGLTIGNRGPNRGSRVGTVLVVLVSETWITTSAPLV